MIPSLANQDLTPMLLRVQLDVRINIPLVSRKESSLETLLLENARGLESPLCNATVGTDLPLKCHRNPKTDIIMILH